MYTFVVSELLSDRAAKVALVLLGVGILIGIVLALRQPLPEPPAETGPSAPAEMRPTFAEYFVHLFPGRTPDGSRPRGSKALVRASKFLAGERVGLRVQTAPERDESFTMEIRFLTQDTREELPALGDDRQRFRIRPGLRTYCCIRMPRETGDYLIGIIVENEFLAYLPIEIKPRPSRLEGGLFTNPED